jgi:hypothetical protein
MGKWTLLREKELKHLNFGKMSNFNIVLVVMRM